MYTSSPWQEKWTCLESLMTLPFLKMVRISVKDRVASVESSSKPEAYLKGIRRKVINKKMI
ncbi:MAG: hypothetical protein VX667_02090 [Nitrospinota bacterium]|nr:hypothetical protein [Nitrospinota bacterium]